MEVVLSDIAFVGILLGVAAAVGLAGIGFGVYVSAKDLNKELAEAWDLGHQAAIADQTKANSLNRPIRPTDNPYKLRRPFLRRTKTDAPIV